MDKIEVKYYSFNHRFWVDTGEIYVLILLAFIELIIISLTRDLILIINFATAPFFLLIAYRNFIRAKKYVTQIEIDENKIYLLMVDFNKMLKRIEIPLTDFRIDITENFSDRFRRFKLEFKRKSLSKMFDYDLIHKQYEIGGWTMEKQKETYKIIKDKQGRFSGTASIGRTIFGESKEQKHESITGALHQAGAGKI